MFVQSIYLSDVLFFFRFEAEKHNTVHNGTESWEFLCGWDIIACLCLEAVLECGSIIRSGNYELVTVWHKTENSKIALRQNKRKIWQGMFYMANKTY